MIYINNHLTTGEVYKSHRDMFPMLYYTDFSGKSRQIKHIHVELCGGDVYIQTDITDCEQLKRETDRILSDMLETARKKATEARNVIDTIEKVMEVHNNV